MSERSEKPTNYQIIKIDPQTKTRESIEGTDFIVFAGDGNGVKTERYVVIGDQVFQGFEDDQGTITITLPLTENPFGGEHYQGLSPEQQIQDYQRVRQQAQTGRSIYEQQLTPEVIGQALQILQQHGKTLITMLPYIQKTYREQ